MKLVAFPLFQTESFRNLSNNYNVICSIGTMAATQINENNRMSKNVRFQISTIVST